MNATYDYDQLRAAVADVREGLADAQQILLLADYTEASLDHADLVDGVKR